MITSKKTINYSNSSNSSTIKQSRLSIDKRENIKLTDNNEETVINAILSIQMKSEDSPKLANAISQSIQNYGIKRFDFFYKLCNNFFASYQNECQQLFVFLCYLREIEHVPMKYEYLVIIRIASFDLNPEFFEQHLGMLAKDFDNSITSYLSSVAQLLQHQQSNNKGMDSVLCVFGGVNFNVNNKQHKDNIVVQLKGLQTTKENNETLDVIEVLKNIVFYTSCQKTNPNINHNQICQQLFAIYQVIRTNRKTTAEIIEYIFFIDCLLICAHRLQSTDNKYTEFLNNFGQTCHYIYNSGENYEGGKNFMLQFETTWSLLPNSIMRDNETVFYQKDDLLADTEINQTQNHIQQQFSVMENLNNKLPDINHSKTIIALLFGSASILWVYTDTQDNDNQKKEVKQAEVIKLTEVITTPTEPLSNSNNQTAQYINPVGHNKTENNDFIPFVL